MRIKRFIASLLAAAMTLTSPISSLADVSGSGQGNAGAGVITGRGGDFSANVDSSLTSGKLGIRLTLVDRNDPTKIISVDDNGKPRVVDFLYVTQDTFDYQAGGQYWSKLEDWYTYVNPKTQTTPVTLAEGTIGLHRVYYNEILEKIPASPIEPWLYHDGSRYVSKGVEFVDWCKTNDSGQEVVGNGSELFTVGIGGNAIKVKVFRDGDSLVTIDVLTGNSASYSYEGADNKPLETVVSDIEYDSTKDSLRSSIERYGAESTAKSLISFTAQAYAALATPEISGSNEDATALLQRLDKARTDCIANLADLREESAEMQSAVDTIIAQVSAGLYDHYNTSMKYKGNAANQQYTTENTVNDMLNGDVQIDEGIDVDDTLSASHIQRLLTMYSGDDNNKNYYLQTPSMLELKKQGKPHDISQATENWILVVEPVIWYTIFPNGTDAYAIETKQYGTISNITQAFNTVPSLIPYANTKTFNWKSINQPVWWALTVPSINQGEGADGFAFQFGADEVEDTEGLVGGDTVYNPNCLAYYYPSGIGNFKTFAELYTEMTQPQQRAVTKLVDGVATTKNFNQVYSGFGVNFYSAKDILNPTPQYTVNIDDDSSTTAINNPIKVAKWYVVENRDENNNVISQSTVAVETGTLDRSKPIAIVNESVLDGAGVYEVTGWATGKDESAIPRDNDLSSTFEEYIVKSPGTMMGVDPTLIDMSTKPDEKTLYIKLVFQVTAPPEGDTTVVKVKEPADGSTPIIEHDTTNPGTTYPADENGWNYTEDIQTPDPEVPVTKWEDVPTTGTPGTNPNIPVQDNTKTIYIRYTQDPAAEEPTPAGTMVLHQNELSYGYDLRDLTQNGVLALLQENFDSMSGSVRYCSGGHSCSNDDCSGNHKCGYRSRKIADKYYRLSVTSSNTAPNFILDWAEKDGSWSISGSKSISGGKTSVLDPNADFLLYRDKLQDLVTLYPNKNASTKGELSRLGITAESYTPATHRIGSTGSGKFYATYQTNFTHDSDYDNELSWTWNGSRGCYESGTWNSSEISGRRLSDLNATYSQQNNTEFRYELGQANTASAAPSETIDQTFTNVFANNTDVTVAQDGKLDFYPYIKMKLNDKNNSSSDVYVTSTNLSSMPAYSKIEAGVWKGTAVDSDSANGNNPTPNVNLTSTQWSTHKSSLEFISDNDIDDKNTVLPGGAIFDVDMKRNTSAQWTGEPGDTPTTSTKLGYRIWQTCVPDELASALAPGSTAPTVSEAKNQVTAFDESVKKANNVGTSQLVPKL